MIIYLKQYSFLIFIAWILAGCGGSSGSSISLNQPNLPITDISRIELPDDYVGFIIGSKPLTTNPSSSDSLRFTQQLYSLDAENNITEVAMYDSTDTQIDFTGNLSYTDQENIIPLDIMVLSPDYLLLTIFQRNFDTNPDNDYFNLLIDLHNGNVVSAPVGLNKEGNSGRSSLTQLGRDVFPPDARWNSTQDLYVLSVDYDELGQMQSVDYESNDTPEIVDHHNGVPCPTIETEEDTDTTDSSDTADSAQTTAETDNATAVETSDTTATTEETTAQTICTEPIDTTDNDESPTGTSPSVENDSQETTTAESLSVEASSNIMTSRAASNEEPPTPTALYRMDLLESNQYSLTKVSAVGDRPGLGQVIISNNGTIIYRNLDGGDNSYRVLLPYCEAETGRLSTVLLAPYNTFIIAPDQYGVESIFEVTYSGMNKLIFSCNGNVERHAYTSYSTSVSALKLPYNSPSITSYDYAYPYFINTSCKSADLFPSSSGFTSILDPMPAIPGLRSGDVRGLRKSQYFNNRLYCIGYDTSLQLSIAELNPQDNFPQFEFLSFDFSQWLPNFDTLHVLSNGHAIFTGTSRTNPAIRTILINTSGIEVELEDNLSGFRVGQQIEITPPGEEYTLPPTN